MSEPQEQHRKRCKRRDVPGQAHYLTFSCFGRRPLLNRDRTRRWLLQAIDAARIKIPFDLWAWVIMPEHAHLLVRPHEGSRISFVLQAIKQPVARLAIDWVVKHAPEFLSRMTQTTRSGRQSRHFWLPGGGYDRNVYSREEIPEKIRYIHANPARRGLVEHPEDWIWSSYRAWHLKEEEPIRIDRESLWWR